MQRAGRGLRAGLDGESTLRFTQASRTRGSHRAHGALSPAKGLSAVTLGKKRSALGFSLGCRLLWPRTAGEQTSSPRTMLPPARGLAKERNGNGCSGTPFRLRRAQRGSLREQGRHQTQEFLRSFLYSGYFLCVKEGKKPWPSGSSAGRLQRTGPRRLTRAGFGRALTGV